MPLVRANTVVECHLFGVTSGSVQMANFKTVCHEFSICDT